MKSLCLLFCLALLEARANPLPASNQVARSSYPLGIYAVNSTSDFAAVRAAGFNLITGPAERSFLDAADAAGLKVLASPGTSAGAGFNFEAAAKTVKAFDAHPALWAWYLVDEPDLQQIPPETVVRNHAALKRLKPSKPTALVLYQGYEALDYANVTDIMMIDKYPGQLRTACRDDAPGARQGQAAHCGHPGLRLGQHSANVAGGKEPAAADVR
jgi:hypothetical protein